MRIYRIGEKINRYKYVENFGGFLDIVRYRYDDRVLDFLINTDLGLYDLTNYENDYGVRLTIANLLEDVSYYTNDDIDQNTADKLLKIYNKYIKNDSYLNREDNIKGTFLDQIRVRLEKNIARGLTGNEKLQFMKQIGEIKKEPEESKVEEEFRVEDMLK